MYLAVPDESIAPGVLDVNSTRPSWGRMGEIAPGLLHGRVVSTTSVRHRHAIPFSMFPLQSSSPSSSGSATRSCARAPSPSPSLLNR